MKILLSSTMILDDNYLVHHGVQGMKWGVRKQKPSSGSSKKKKVKKSSKIVSKFKKQRSEKMKEKARIKKNTATTKKSVKAMTDTELKNVINRLEMEKRYRSLRAEEITPGRKFVGEVLRTSGKTLAVQTLNYVGGKGINKLFDDEVVRINKQNNKKKAA